MNEYRTNVKLVGGSSKKFHYHVRYNNETSYTSNFVYTVQFNDIDINEVSFESGLVTPTVPNTVKTIRFYDKTLLDNEITAINNYNEFLYTSENNYKDNKYNSYNDYIDDINYNTKNIEKQYLLNDNGVFKSINYIDYLPYKIDDSNENLLSYLKTQNSQFRTFINNENTETTSIENNKINYNTIYGGIDIPNININSIDLFFPLYSVETYNNQPPLYYLQLSTYLNGVKIILTERFIDKRKLKIYNRLIKYNNREYYDYITVEFPNVKDIIYSDNWKEFRKLYCMTNFDLTNDDNEINDSNCDLYIELHPIYIASQNDFKFSEVYENNLENVKQLIVNTYNDKSNFKGGSNVIQMLSSEQSTELHLHSYINVLESNLNNNINILEDVINGISENEEKDIEYLEDLINPSINSVIEFGNTFNDYHRDLEINITEEAEENEEEAEETFENNTTTILYRVNDLIEYLEEVYNLASFNENNDLYIVTDFNLYIKTNEDLYKYYNGYNKFVSYNDYLDALLNKNNVFLKEILESLINFKFIYKNEYRTIKKQYTDAQPTFRYSTDVFEFDKWDNSFINGLNAYIICNIYAFNYDGSQESIEEYFEEHKNTEEFCFGITLNSNVIPFIKENFKYFLSESNFNDDSTDDFNGITNILQLVTDGDILKDLKNNLENMKVLNIVNKVVKNNVEMDLNNQSERVNYITKPVYYRIKDLNDLAIDKDISTTYEVVINGLEKQLDVSSYTLRLVGEGAANFISIRVDRLKSSIMFPVSIEELPEISEDSTVGKAYILDANGTEIASGTFYYK